MTSSYQWMKKYPLEPKVLFELSQRVMLACGFQICMFEATIGMIQGKSGMSILSWGEDIDVLVLKDGIIRVQSISTLRTTLVDYGKNRRNVESFFRTMDAFAIINPRQ